MLCRKVREYVEDKNKRIYRAHAFSGRKYNCKSPVHIFNSTISACESVLEVKSKKKIL